jgi:hypothetical protein
MKPSAWRNIRTGTGSTDRQYSCRTFRGTQTSLSPMGARNLLHALTWFLHAGREPRLNCAAHTCELPLGVVKLRCRMGKHLLNVSPVPIKIIKVTRTDTPSARYQCGCNVRRCYA